MLGSYKLAGERVWITYETATDFAGRQIMLPWRRQASRPREAAEGDGIASSQDLLLQSAASLPPLLLNGSTSPPGAGTLDQQQHHQGLQTGAGSLQHSLSCPQTEYRSSSKGAQSLQRSLTNSRQQQQQDRAHMVRTSDPQHAVLQLPAGTHAGNGRNSDGSSDQQLALALPGEQQITAWARPGSPAGQHQQQLSPAHTHSNGAGMQHHHQHHHQQHQQLELERRKFTRNLLSANNKKESLERYKAIMALIEACKRRLEVQLGPAGAAAAMAMAAWSSEPLASLLQSVLDVGEALASFGNCHFPEHSNEARAILAGDYRALLRQYLSTFGFVFAAPTKQQMGHDMQEEVQCVGSLLATRCDAYDLLYDQLVRHVGLEGRSGPQTFILNQNSAAANPTTTITANPVNTTSATASSKSKALNSGLGAAAIAAAGLVGLVLVKVLRGGGGSNGGGRRGSKGSSGSSRQAGSSGSNGSKPLRVPKGRNGRELLLVSQLSGCADELRRAAHNEELLKDDWRLGRHVRLAWPPGPPLPPGHEPLAADACNVSQLLQELYG